MKFFTLFLRVYFGVASIATGRPLEFFDTLKKYFSLSKNVADLSRIVMAFRPKTRLVEPRPL